MEDTEVIDEASICGDCSDEEDNRDDTNEAGIQWMLSSSRLTALVKSTPVHGTL